MYVYKTKLYDDSGIMYWFCFVLCWRLLLSKCMTMNPLIHWQYQYEMIFGIVFANPNLAQLSTFSAFHVRMTASLQNTPWSALAWKSHYLDYTKRNEAQKTNSFSVNSKMSTENESTDLKLKKYRISDTLRINHTC